MTPPDTGGARLDATTAGATAAGATAAGATAAAVATAGATTAGATTAGAVTGGGPAEPMLPDYAGPCLTTVVPALLERGEAPVPAWIPAEAAGADQVVLLVLDGLGWHGLQARRSLAPTLAGARGGAIRSVVPTTTATALTSLSTGMTPAEHGVIGYRIRIRTGDGDEVMNVLRWRSESGDLRRRVPAPSMQPVAAFGGRPVPVVTRAEFVSTGFSAAHLGGARMVGWSVPSTLLVEVGRLLAGGEPFVYAYYDGLDKVAHQYGLGEHYDRELVFVDHLVRRLVDQLPPRAALVLTSDHGQVDVPEPARLLEPDVMDGVALLSGEGRFRWLHARPGAAEDVRVAAEETLGDAAWVLSRKEIVEAGWFGHAMRPEVEDRLGDVAVLARLPVAFLDPADTGETRLLARHGSLTPEEVEVPLIAFGSG